MVYNAIWEKEKKHLKFGDSVNQGAIHVILHVRLVFVGNEKVRANRGPFNWGTRSVPAYDDDI